MANRKERRIGIFSGTFDPVHKGHISFALQAITEAGLDKVVFIPEPKPRHKHEVTHIGHRLAMLELALKVCPNLDVMELPDKQFTVKSSLPRIKKQFPECELVMLVGTDVLKHISVWPYAKVLLKDVGLVVAARGQADERHALALLSQLPVEPPESHVVVSQHKMMSSSAIRADLKAGRETDEVLKTVKKYAAEHWIYTSVAGSASKS